VYLRNWKKGGDERKLKKSESLIRPKPIISERKKQMKKKIAIALALCLLVLIIMVAPVFAAAHKVDLISYAGEPGSGFVIGNSCQGPESDQLSPGEFHKGAGLVRISLKGAMPNAEYEVWIVIPHPVLPDVWIPIWGPFGPLETNAQGNGNFIGEKLLGVPPGEAQVEYGLFRGGEMRFKTEEPVINIVK